MIAPQDIMMEMLTKTARTSSSEFKGTAVYFNLVMPDDTVVEWMGAG